MDKLVVLFLIGLAVVSALPQQTIIRKLGLGLRYQYVQDSAGQPHLVDLWGTSRDVADAVRYNPDTENVYHLFTRSNPTISQPLVPGNSQLLSQSNFNPADRTVVVVHGWGGGNPLLGFNSVMVPAFLANEPANVIVVDWTRGSGTINYLAAMRNTVTSGESVARFVNWLDNAKLHPLQARYHIVGFSLGAQQAGVIGRNLARPPAYVTGLDPAGPGWENNDQKLKATDGAYTEVIHTHAGGTGYLEPMGDVDFYPNGGIGMPGCSSSSCDHDRSFHYFAESLRTGGFTGQKCEDFTAAMNASCNLPETLQMGGLVPKTGKTGVYYLETNSAPPFSRD